MAIGLDTYQYHSPPIGKVFAEYHIQYSDGYLEMMVFTCDPPASTTLSKKSPRLGTDSQRLIHCVLLGHNYGVVSERLGMELVLRSTIMKENPLAF